MPGSDPHPPYRPLAQTQPGRNGSAVPRRNDATTPHAMHVPTRPGRPDEVHISALSLDPFAELTLALMRLHFQTFAAPETQGWLAALRLATTHVGPRAAGQLCYDLVALVQALREARTSTFAFNADGCACCCVWLTPEERRLMELLDTLRHRQIGRARVVVQMLCDGAQGDHLTAMAETYLHRHAPEFTQPGVTMPTRPQED